MVSKEISTMENEMLEFKDFLAEWKSMPSLLHIDDSASVAGEYKIAVYLTRLSWMRILQSADGMSVPQ